MKALLASAVSLVAALSFGGTLYVSTTGSDDTGTGASDAPFKTIQHAYEVAQTTIWGGEPEMTVYLAPGTHQITKTVANADVQFVVEEPVKFVGQGSSPGDVTLRLQYSFDWNGSFNGNVVTLNHGGAALVNLTIADGFIFNWGGIASEAAGCTIRHGMVSNCVIRNCETRGNNCRAAGVYLGSSDAVLSHSIIRSCRTWNTSINADTWQWSKVGGVQMNNGRIENCIVQNCKIEDNASMAANAKYVGGVLASGGTVVNCTIVGNSGYHTGGMYAYSNARVYNCVFAGNSLYDHADGGVDDHARLANSGLYFNCASDTTSPINADQNCITGTAAAFFVDYANADFSPIFGSPLINAGANTYVNEATDIVGTTRICGGAVDIGAYETLDQILVNITVGVSGNGSVTIPNGPYVAGEIITLTAVPDEGFVFVQWQGDVPAEYAETASFTFAPTHDVSLTAFFALANAVPVQYVSTTGSDDNDGFTAASPRKTIPIALRYLDESFGYGDIFIEAGTYSLSETLIVTNAISITGLGTTPDDTIVRNGRGGSNERDYRVIAIDSAGAKVSNLTLADGLTLNWGGLTSVYRNAYGGCATLYAGVVSNCVIRNGRQYDWYAYAGGIYVGGADALLTHTIIRDCNGGEKDASWSASKGGGVWISAGRMENCLVWNCQITDPNKTDGAGGIRVTGGTVANCTVLGCSSHHTGGIYASGGSVVNCAIGLSKHRTEGETVVPWAGGSSRFDHCAADVDTPINSTCFAAPTDELFLGASTGDGTPCFGSLLVDNGATVALASTTDLNGTARVKGNAIDIGAYEAETEIPITVTLEASDYGTTTGAGEHIAGRPLTITATPIAGYVFYCWDGNFPAENLTQASFTFIPTINYTAYPRFVKADTVPVQYVSTTGSDENDGFTVETARATVQSAHDYLAATYGFGTINVLPGTYRYPAVLKITSPVAIVGCGESPAGVVFRNSSSRNNEDDARVLEMNSAQASIAGVTLADGAVQSWGLGSYLRGGCATIKSGTVTNCVVSGGRQSNWCTTCGGIGLTGPNAFMTHSVVTNCMTTMADNNNWTIPRAGGVFIEGGRMENCLIVDCEVRDVNSALSASAGGVRLVSGVVANCTILGCRGNYAGGLNAAGGTVYNTVVYGCTNLGDGSISTTSGTASRYVNCATDAESAINETCVIVGAKDFVDVAAGNYTPIVDGVLYNGGAAIELRSSTDLAGNPRIASKGIDIGAYESKGRGTCILLR